MPASIVHRLARESADPSLIGDDAGRFLARMEAIASRLIGVPVEVTIGDFAEASRTLVTGAPMEEVDVSFIADMLDRAYSEAAGSA